MPAFNNAKTIAQAIDGLPDIVDQTVVVDDGSADDSGRIAQEHGARVVRHVRNRGYGGAQKTGYAEALKAGADIIVMVHADFQYDPALLPDIVTPVIRGEADVCIGSRMHDKKSARKGGMPLWRFIPNIALTAVEDAVLGLGLSEYHSGYRAFSRKVLMRIPFEENSDNYVFDSEVLAQIAAGKFRAAEIAVPTRYFKEAASPNFFKSTEYGMMTLAVLGRYLLHRAHLRTFPQFNIKSIPS